MGVKVRGLAVCPPVGTLVRLTGYFLRATGQMVGSEGTKRWRTVRCVHDCGMCGSGFTAVDEPHEARTDPRGYEDIAPEIRAGMWRHVNLSNLEICSAPPRAADQADEVGPIASPKRRTKGKGVR